MKIACIGNMNNILAPAAQYLSKLGHEVDLFLLYEYDHFAPESDYSNTADIQFHIKKLGMDFGNIFSISKKEIKAKLAGYDYYIGTDYAPGILARIGLKLDMFAWAGTDLFEWPFYHSAFRIPQLWEIDLIKTARHQLAGIQSARIMPMSINNGFILSTLKKVKFPGKIIPPLPFMYYPEAEKNLSLENEHILLMKEDMSQGRLVLVQQSRQWWKSAPDFISKGNDIFLKGVALFKKTNPNKPIRVYLFSYGADIQASKELIEELGLHDDVRWLPLMKRKELLAVIGNADIGVGQFGSESWYLFCSNAEIIFSGAAYLGYRDDGFCTQNHCELYPMLNANSPETIAIELEKYIQEPILKNTHSQNAKNWILKYNETEFINNISADFADSPSRYKRMNLGLRLGLKSVEFGMFWVSVINRMILFTRIPFLKTAVIEWKKN